MRKIAVVTTSLERFKHASSDLRRDTMEYIPIMSEEDLIGQEFDGFLANMTLEETKIEKNAILIKATKARMKK